MNHLSRFSLSRTKTPEVARNVAELLCDLGQVLRWRLRREQRSEAASTRQETLGWEGKLALQFVSLKPALQLRAMVEDWPMKQIQDAVALERLETQQAREGQQTTQDAHVTGSGCSRGGVDTGP